MERFLDYASGAFTIRDEMVGFPETKARLQSYSDTDLAEGYLTHQRDCFDRVFGRTARRFHALIAAELLRRGITEIPHLFGPIVIRSAQEEGR